jgi:site-specific DNA-methyltransferase (adenine-specific)
VSDLPLDQVILGDCLDAMLSWPAQSVDMVLCDLPYGTQSGARHAWECALPLDVLWAQYRHLLKERGVVALLAQTPFDKVLGASNLRWLRYEWIWHKAPPTGHLNANRAPLKAHENVLIFYEKQPLYQPQMGRGEPYHYARGCHGDNYGTGRDERQRTINGGQRYPTSVLRIRHDHARYATYTSLHPQQKPVELFSYLIRTYTCPGAIVVDHCMGSGTTALACLREGRRFVGVEIDPVHWTTCQRRLKEWTESVA